MKSHSIAIARKESTSGVPDTDDLDVNWSRFGRLVTIASAWNIELNLDTGQHLLNCSYLKSWKFLKYIYHTQTNNYICPSYWDLGPMKLGTHWDLELGLTKIFCEPTSTVICDMISSLLSANTQLHIWCLGYASADDDVLCCDDKDAVMQSSWDALVLSMAVMTVNITSTCGRKSLICPCLMRQNISDLRIKSRSLCSCGKLPQVCLLVFSKSILKPSSIFV